MASTSRPTTESPLECARHLLEVIPRAMRSIRTEMRRKAQPELTVPQFRVLARLSISPATNGEVAEWIGVSVPAMSRMVELLARRGYVQKERQSEDRRQVRLLLSAKGKSHFLKIRGQAQRSL